MFNKFTKQYWDWRISGLLLGFVFLMAVAVVKPIGVSTQFVILDGIIWNSLSKDLVTKDESAKKGYASSNSYLNKSGGKYAKSIAKPINYSFVFVIAMIIGGFLAYMTSSKNKEENLDNEVWEKNYKSSGITQYIFIFLGGILVLFGARLAGGCSSGHMMSGMMQTSLSGYLFAMATFAIGIPVAKIIYRR